MLRLTINGMECFAVYKQTYNAMDKFSINKTISRSALFPMFNVRWLKFILNRHELSIVKHDNMASVDPTLQCFFVAFAVEGRTLPSLGMSYVFFSSYISVPYFPLHAFVLSLCSFIYRSFLPTFPMLRHFSFVRHHIWTELRSRSFFPTWNTRRCCNDKSFLLFVFATPSIAFRAWVLSLKDSRAHGTQHGKSALLFVAMPIHLWSFERMHPAILCA